MATQIITTHVTNIGGSITSSLETETPKQQNTLSTVFAAENISFSIMQTQTYFNLLCENLLRLTQMELRNSEED